MDHRCKQYMSPILWCAFVIVGCSALACARDVAVPSRCTAEINQKLSELIAAGEQHTVDNVMVCGTTVSSSRRRRGGRRGAHEIIPLRAPMPGGSEKLIEVVSNDDLDGRVTAPVNAQVFAYGQAFFARTGKFAAGIHDVHCATHRGADNGWVVVNGGKHPANCTR